MKTSSNPNPSPNPNPNCRATVKGAAGGGLADWGTILMLLALVLTVYRLPAFIGDVCHRMRTSTEEAPFTKVWFFFCIMHHLAVIKENT